MKHNHICFVWHMHQPYYTDPVTGSASMPWVRLHATKAYYDMAYMLEQFPSVRATFNFTPSLLLQLQEIGSGTVRDLFLEYAECPASDLTPEGQAFLTRHFFSANWSTMVHPHPRYHELLVTRGQNMGGQDLAQLARRFSTQDFLDLQVWHNLAWFGYAALRRHPHLAELREKNRGFTERDKQEVLTLQRTVVQDVVPRYRTLLERGQIETTTTPFFHPILPLVIDTDFAERARPDLPLPPRFRAPDDAETQIRRAIEFHKLTFGRAPVGLWPSEGSVCPELLPIAHRAGLQWLATDESILARSLEMEGHIWNRQAALYRPYLTGADGQDLTILFRDREISDAFGFVYHKTTPEAAADDAIRRLTSIIQNTAQEQAIIAIILDGENPWEHYHDGGERFLSLLYSAFSEHRLDQDHRVAVHASTVSEALASAPSPQHLSTLHSGSWINADYKIWIGHEEDNRAWEWLGRTRARLRAVTSDLPKDRARAAWDELYAAEGSDWFWWYGDDFDTDFKPEFDRLFRTHLRNVWLHMGLAAPDSLSRPMFNTAFHQEPHDASQPLTLLSPTIDGTVTDFFEWRGAGTIPTHPPLGAMWKHSGPFSAIRFGWNHEQLSLRFDFDKTTQSRPDGMGVEIFLNCPENTFRLSFSLDRPGPNQFIVARSAEGDSWVEVGSYRSICRNTIVELSLPWHDLHLELGQEVRMWIVASEHGLESSRYPYLHAARLTVPDAEFDAALWRV